MAVSFDYVSQNSRASQRFIELAGVRRSFASLFIPPHLALIGQYEAGKTGITDYAPQKVLDSNDVGNRYGWGSHIHRQSLKIPASVFSSGNGVTAFPIPEAPAGVAASGTIIFTGAATSSGTLYFLIGGVLVYFGVTSGDSVTAIGDALVAAIAAKRDIAVSAVNAVGTVTITAKGKGTFGNQIFVKQSPAGKAQEDVAPAGTVVSGTALDSFLTAGATDPDLHDVFLDVSETDKLGDTWYTVFTSPYSDATNLGYYTASGALRSDPAVRRFFGAFPVFVNYTRSQALAFPATINSKWIGALWESRAWDPAFEMSAEVAGIIAREQNLAPSRPYKTLAMSSDGDKSTPNSTYLQEDALFRAGIGFFKFGSDGTLRLGDIPLTYRKDVNGGDDESWFDAVSLFARQAKVYSIEQLFGSDPYARGVVTDNNAVTVVDFAVAPKDVIADLTKLVRDLWEPYGWTKNADAVIAGITAEINAGNNSRIDAQITDDEAKALRIIAIKYAFLY